MPDRQDTVIVFTTESNNTNQQTREKKKIAKKKEDKNQKDRNERGKERRRGKCDEKQTQHGRERRERLAERDESVIRTREWSLGPVGVVRVGKDRMEEDRVYSQRE